MYAPLQNKPKRKVLVLEDDCRLKDALIALLKQHGFSTETLNTQNLDDLKYLAKSLDLPWRENLAKKALTSKYYKGKYYKTPHINQRHIHRL